MPRCNCCGSPSYTTRCVDCDLIHTGASSSFFSSDDEAMGVYKYVSRVFRPRRLWRFKRKSNA